MASVPDDIDTRRLSLGDHLEELRRHVFRSVLWFLAAFAVCLVFQDQLMDWATYPHRHVMEQLRKEALYKGALDRLPADLVSDVSDVLDSREALERDVRELERNGTILKEKLEKEPKVRVAGLAARRGELAVEIARIKAEQRKLLDGALDANRVARLEKDRAALVDRVSAFSRDVSSEIAPLMESDARVPKVDLIQLRYTEGIMAYFQVATICALFLGSPFVARELWKFVAAGLHRHEKRYVRTFAPLTFAVFVIGCCFGYFVLIPAGLKFLATYGSEYIIGQFALSDYLSLFLSLTLAVGLIFELPLVMTFLALVGVLTPEFYVRFRRYWVLIAFIIAAIVSPTPDPFNQVLCAVPLILLYEAGILASRWLASRHVVGTVTIPAPLAAPLARLAALDAPPPSPPPEVPSVTVAPPELAVPYVPPNRVARAAPWPVANDPGRPPAAPPPASPAPPAPDEPTGAP